MARFFENFFGRLRGRLGNLIFSSWLGISYIRIQTAKFHDPRTPSQRRCRSRFAACSKMGSILSKTLIRPVWKPVAQKMTGYNLFMSTNVNNFDNKGTICNYPGFVFSFGDLPGLQSPSVKVIPGTSDMLELSWSDNSDEASASPDDKLKVVEITGQKVSFIHELPFTRSDGAATFRSNREKESQVYCYPFFSNAEFTRFSPNNFIPVSFNDQV
jgi:hypothetical protein